LLTLILDWAWRQEIAGKQKDNIHGPTFNRFSYIFLFEIIHINLFCCSLVNYLINSIVFQRSSPFSLLWFLQYCSIPTTICVC